MEINADNPQYAPRAPEIEAPGIYDRPAVGRDDVQTLDIAFAQAGTRQLRTAGPGGNGCTGDSVLTVGRQSRQSGYRYIAHNDDDPDGSGCSTVEFNAEAGVTYTVRIKGYGGFAIDPFVLVIE